MKLVKKGHKWIVEGSGHGWIFTYAFPTKWKAIIGMEVYKKGGEIKDYWLAARENPPIPKKASHVRYQVEKALKVIEELNPTGEEIEQYGENAGHGVVTYTIDKGYYPPHLHDTWEKKFGGRVHIDIGSGGTHLMLDKYSAPDFIEFIKNKRSKHD